MSGISKQIAMLTINNLKMANGATVKQNIVNETHKLLACIQDEIDNYYESYQPKSYKRTNRFRNSIKAEDFINIKISGNAETLDIIFKLDVALDIIFKPELAYHPSLWKEEGGEDGYVPLLINDGWCWKGYEKEKEDHFHKYNGFHFIEKGIEAYNKVNRFNIRIKVQKTIEGQRIEPQWY